MIINFQGIIENNQPNLLKNRVNFDGKFCVDRIFKDKFAEFIVKREALLASKREGK